MKRRLIVPCLVDKKRTTAKQEKEDTVNLTKYN